MSLAVFDEEIVTTRAMLDEHPDTRCALLTKVNARHDPMGHRLPVEMVSNIFQHCLPEPPSPDTFQGISKEFKTDHEFFQTTAKLTNVNRNWRDIAHSTPGLWNSIFLDFTRWSLSEDRLAVLLTNLKQCIQRSGDLLLSIRITAKEDPILVLYCVQMLEVLCLEAHRWRSLCISAPRKVITVISTRPFPKGSPYLDCIILNSHNRVAPDDWVLKFDTVRAPLLAPSYLSIRTISFSTSTFDFTRLIYIALGSIANSKIVCLLDFWPELTTLECQLFNDDQPFSSNPTLTHPSLKTLKLTIVDAIPNLLSNIILPSLETLICRFEFSSNARSILYDFLFHSNSSLRTLSVDMQCGEQDFIELLHLTPGLYHLRIHSEITSRFFHYLGETACLCEDQDVFLPHLRSIAFSLNIFQEEAFSWSFLRSLVPAISSTGSKCRPLPQVTIYVDNLRLKLIDRLNLLEFIVGGLEIMVYSRGDYKKKNELYDYKPLADALAMLRARSFP
ncbi:hypothetical protein CPB83DRAFT_855075, partial [Crepidotus variabilis]